MRITWESEGCEPPETYQANAVHACSLGLPFVTPGTRGSLAVAGGGPSILKHLDKLKGYDEVWGINRTAVWLRERGIEATFFSVDPQYMPGMTNVGKAIVATSLHPRLFEELAGKDVSLFHIRPVESHDGFVSDGGCSSACRAIPLASHMGYSSVTFFGCEGSYDGDSHAYSSDLQTHQLVIRAGGRDYITQPDFQLQCEYIVPFLTAEPSYFKEESGGLLRAMAADPDWFCAAVSAEVAKRILPEGATLDDLPPYEVAA
jgi:hypothetical protein